MLIIFDTKHFLSQFVWCFVFLSATAFNRPCPPLIYFHPYCLPGPLLVLPSYVANTLFSPLLSPESASCHSFPCRQYFIFTPTISRVRFLSYLTISPILYFSFFSCKRWSFGLLTKGAGMFSGCGQIGKKSKSIQPNQTKWICYFKLFCSDFSVCLDTPTWSQVSFSTSSDIFQPLLIY